MSNTSFKRIHLRFVIVFRSLNSQSTDDLTLFFVLDPFLFYINCQSRHIDLRVANFICFKKTYCFLQVKMEANEWVLILREWSKLYFTLPVFPLCPNLLLHTLFECLELCSTSALNVGLEVLLTHSNVFVCHSLICFVRLVSHFL